MFSSILRHAARPGLFLAVALALVAPRASSQCFGPDLLDIGACCQPAQLNLPSFPQGIVPGLGICWNGCSVSGTQDLRVSWSPPSQVTCGEFVSQLTVSDGTTGAPLLSGLLVLDYTRTWEEIDNAGNTTQVWRFAAKVDLSAVTGTPPSLCVTPTCINPIGPYGTSFYYGYLDYENCAAASPWENALVLFHNCDRFIHRPGLSDKPGTFHPGGSYAIVAPHSTVQPFVPMNNIAPGGPLVGEATRNVNGIPGTLACMVEDRVTGGNITTLGAGCVCTLTANPKQQTLRQVAGTTGCVNLAGVPGAFASVKMPFPAMPWFHMVSTSIGSWTSPASYPGKETAWVDEGVFIVQDACTGDFAEFKYGGSTKDGWLPVLPIPVLVTNFTDLADNYTAPLFGPYPFPFIGSVQPTDHLLYVNTP